MAKKAPNTKAKSNTIKAVQQNEEAEYKPYKYKPEFCQKVIEHHREGGSLSSFVCVAKVNRTTLYEWIEHIPEFKEAVAQAKAEYQRSLEKVLRGKITGQEGGGFNLSKSDTTALIFALKTRCYQDYGDKSKLTLSNDELEFTDE